MINKHAKVRMLGIFGTAILCVFQIGVRGFVSGPSLPGGFQRVKPWYFDVQQAAQFAVYSYMHPRCRLMFVSEAYRQVINKQIQNTVTHTANFLIDRKCKHQPPMLTFKQ